MQSSNNKASAAKPEPFQSHFLIADLITPAPLLPGAGSCQVLKIIPPRETVSDPAHLEAFFVTLVSLLSRSTGNGQLAGARLNGGTSAKQHAKNKMARQAFLSGAGDQPKAKANLTEDTVSELKNFELEARLKGIAKQYRSEWQHVVSFEIAGRYQEVCFLLRIADPTMLSSIVGLLRQEYPHLSIETLNTDLKAAIQFNRSVTADLLSPSARHRTKPESAYGNGSLQKWRTFDPLVIADDSNRQLSACRYLMLSEHPTMPLTLPGNPNSRKSTTAADPKATPLRRLLTALAGLQPGEIACSQLLVFGPVAKEWVKYQEAQALRLQERQAASYKVSASGMSSGPRRNTTTNSHSSTPSPSDSRGLLIITILAALLCAGFLSWSEFQPLLESGDTTQIALWLGLRLILIFGVMAIILVIWWVVRSEANGGRRKGEVFSMQPLQEKFSSPPVLAALRQVVSLSYEPYLQRVCCDPLFKSRFEEQGFSQTQATKLYRLRQDWSQHEQQGGSDQHFTISIKQKLSEINNSQNHSVWEFAYDMAQALLEERLDALQENLAAGYSPFGSATANAFVTVPGESVPAQSFSSLLPYDWSSPQRLRSPGIASLWPFNTPLFDWLNDLFDRELPPAAREHQGLLVLNALELSYLWHLPGGYETLDFIDRSGPKTLSPPSHLLHHSGDMVRLDSFSNDYQSQRSDATTNPLFGLNIDDTDE